MSRDDVSVRSWTLRVMTGLPMTSGGQSHSWVTPTSSSPSPMAQTISVADGRSETMRIRDGLALSRDGPRRREAEATLREPSAAGLISSTAARAADLSVYQVASMVVNFAHSDGSDSSGKIAFTGHSGSQAPQSMHSFGSMNSLRSVPSS